MFKCVLLIISLTSQDWWTANMLSKTIQKLYRNSSVQPLPNAAYYSVLDALFVLLCNSAWCQIFCLCRWHKPILHILWGNAHNRLTFPTSNSTTCFVVSGLFLHSNAELVAVMVLFQGWTWSVFRCSLSNWNVVKSFAKKK